MRTRLPRRVRIIALLVIALVATPLISLLFRVPWARMPSILRQEIVTDALVLSLTSSVLAAFIALFLGIPVAILRISHESDDDASDGAASSRGWSRSPVRLWA